MSAVRIEAGRFNSNGAHDVLSSRRKDPRAVEDLIRCASMVIGFCWEYLPPLVLTFVDFEKAFDNVETNAMMSVLVDQGVEALYLRISANCYDRCTTTEHPSLYLMERWHDKRYYIVDAVHGCITMNNEITCLGRKGYMC